MRAQEGPAIDSSLVSGAQLDGDRDQLTRAVRNLLENAVRHAESRVTVALAEHDGAGQLTLSIEDDGPGVAAEARERVFERFARLSDRLALIREENFEAVPAHRAYRRPTSPLIF